MKEQLTLEMLCSYLPYGLKVLRPDNKTILEVKGMLGNLYVFQQDGNVLETYGSISSTTNKPIFRNLQTDLTKEIEHEGERFVPIEKLELTNFSIDNNWIIYDTESLPFYVIQKLISWHFWIYDQSYFEKGIILDFNNVNNGKV